MRIRIWHINCFTILLIVVSVLVFNFRNNTTAVSAQESPSVLYVPLIGITLVPQPLALPNGAGNVTYNYAVKNFIKEEPLTDIQVTDNNCSPIKFANGDDNKDSKLDYSETWRYICTTKLEKTTQSTAIATGHAHNITAIHNAYATVVVGGKDPAPLVSVINVTKVAYPLSLPPEGGKITFTYKVNNPGVTPLNNVTVSDDKCKNVSSRLGDTNGNNLLDINEVWIYTCTTTLTQTTTNSVHVSAWANGLQAVDDATITVKVENSLSESSPSFPETGGELPNIKSTAWETLSGILVVLVIVYIFSRRKKLVKKRYGK